MKKKLPILFLLAFSLALTIVYFYSIIGSLNSVLFTGGGDGIKNYFTYLFYIQNDMGTHFTGMNYPFGENVVFTDNMPLLAWIVKYLSLYFPQVSGHALGIMHASLLLALTGGVYFIYKILRSFNVGAWFAVVASLFIIYFSPQILKLQGHFGMAFLMYLPMQLYWLMKYDQTRKWKFPFFIAFTSFLFAFLHVYNLAFTLVLCMFYVLSHVLVSWRKGWKDNLIAAMPILLSAIVAWVSFAIYLKLTDPITDRTQYPYGLFGSGTVWSDIFLSNFTPFGFIFQFLFGKAPNPSEGYVYIGFVSIAIALFLIFKIFRSIVLRLLNNKQKVPTHPVRDFRLWLWLALFQLLFGMGVPFIWGMGFLADYVSALRQFRAMGRFSWSFYYLFLIFSAILIYRLYRWMLRKHYIWQAKSLLGMVFIVWTIQLSGYAAFMQKNIGQQGKEIYQQVFSENGTTWNKWLEGQGYSPKDFQSLLVLPYFHIGSEKLWLQDNGEARSMYYGSQFAMQTGIPMADVMMSRTSWAQTFANVQTIDGPLSSKPALGMYSDKLVIVLVNKTFPLMPKEMEWTQFGKFIGTRDNLDLYAVNIKDVLSYDEHFTDSLKSLALANPEKEGLIHDAGEFYFVDHFEKGSDEFLFFGNRSYNPVVRTEYQLIATIKPDISKEKMLNYFFSIWVKCSDNDYRSPYFIFKQYDKDNNFLGESDLNTKYSTHIYDYWFLIDKVLTFDPNMDRMEIYVVSQSGERSYFALAEMAIWPTNKFYFHKVDENKILINNRIN